MVSQVGASANRIRSGSGGSWRKGDMDADNAVARQTLSYRLTSISRSEGWIKWSTKNSFLAWLLVRIPLAILALVLFPLTLVLLTIVAFIDSGLEQGWKTAIVGESQKAISATA
jgi:hypothetical protein